MQMKLITTKISVALVAMALIIPSCKKYDDGPSLSLRSKKARIANTWKIETATRDNKNVSDEYDDFTLDLTKSGGATLTYTYFFAGSTFNISTSGTWDLINDKDDLRLDFDANDSDVTYRILRLKEKELWLRDGNTELHLMPK